MVRVRPARDGLKIRCPETRMHLPPEGREVDLAPAAPHATFWQRLIGDGDVVVDVTGDLEVTADAGTDSDPR